VKIYPLAYLCELRHRLWVDIGVAVSESTLHFAMHRYLRYTRKKVVVMCARKLLPWHKARYRFFLQLQQGLAGSECVFVDETGFDVFDTQRSEGWCVPGTSSGAREAADQLTTPCSSSTRDRGPQGQRVITLGTTIADAGKRLSFLAALGVGGVIPVTATTVGTWNGAKFNWWWSSLLLPALAALYPNGVIIVLDNAAIHQPAVLRALAAPYGNIHVVFLPTYSPELSPVRASCWDPSVHALTTACADRVDVWLAEVPHPAQRRPRHDCHAAADGVSGCVSRA
jgi:DDE superfamily endonuclease